MEEAKLIVLETMKEHVACEIKIGNFGAFSTEDPDYERFYLVEWTGTPYNAKEDMYLHDYNPPIFIKEGEMLVKARYLDKVPRALGWWMVVDHSVTVRVQQVLVSDVGMVEPSVEHKLPRSIRQRDII